MIILSGILKTIHKRKLQVKRTISEIITIVEDKRSKIAGGIVTGIQLWEVAAIPHLLHNGGSWLGVNKQCIKILDDLQNDFYRSLFACWGGCPLPLLLFDTNGTRMCLRIMQKKLLFLHHAINSAPDTLINEFISIQQRLNLPSILQECHEDLM